MLTPELIIFGLKATLFIWDVLGLKEWVEGINFKDFIVYEDADKKDDVYCTGIIIELPEDFKSSKE